MVKTRHVNPADDHSDKEFVTLNSRKKKKATSCKNTTNGYESDTSGAAAEQKVSPSTGDSPPPHCRRTRSRGKQSRHSLPPRRSTRERKKKIILYSSSEDEEGEEHGHKDGGRAHKRCRTEPSTHEEPKMDMYSRVKRDRVQVKRDMYGVPVNDDGQACDSMTEDYTDAVTETEDQDDEPEARSYYLREHKPKVNLYEAPPIVAEPKARSRRMFESSHHHSNYRSPARHSNSFRKKRRAAFHGSSSTSSSSCDDGGDNASDDERRFDRRKAKSMAKARQRCRPMNFGEDDAASVPMRDRAKSGASLADVDPMNIDRSVTFESIGGMGKHIHSLKEMIVFPLLYPEVFDRFKIVPPRGVLFYGPPGTGKTLVARALANECSSGEKKVAFFMRKGADCLSKWVGESERQLRLLFDQAYVMRPSIIFFDEVDGLAPVRSSRQDQIHSSIVSTLLALMDGLDSRGEVVIIGATNRIDSIDPALRRPGRFDREFHFPLPSLQARKQILAIHTSEWVPQLSGSFLEELSERCVGYCGADLRSLCTEAALHALRRRYPQIYATEDRLQLDVSSISVEARDFARATANLVPATQRAAAPPARCLPHLLRPLLSATLEHAVTSLGECFPHALTHTSHVDMPLCGENGGQTGSLLDCLLSDDEEDADVQTVSIYEDVPRQQSGNTSQYLHFNNSGHPSAHRPRLLLAGEAGQGQGTHVGPALLYRLEHIPVHLLDLPALFGVSAKTPEESCSQVFREAMRTCPSVIYVPHIDRWWEAVTDTLRTTFLTLLHDLVPSSPLLLIATSDVQWKSLTKQVRDLFEPSSGEVVSMRNPTDVERRLYMEPLLMHQVPKPPPRRIPASQRSLEVLPKAKPLEPRRLTDVELRRLREQEEATLRQLRLFLRDVINKLATDRKFSVFARPVDIDDVPDYYQIIKQPMDLSTMMTKIDNLKYQTVQQFLDDISRICMNALQYNPDLTPEDKAIRHRACALRDTALTYTTAELDPDFEKNCRDIVESRHRRGELDPSDAPIETRTPPVGVRAIVRKVRVKTSPKRSAKYVSPWCRPRRKVQYRKMVVYVDENGEEVSNEQLGMENTLHMSQLNGVATTTTAENSMELQSSPLTVTSQSKDLKAASPAGSQSSTAEAGVSDDDEDDGADVCSTGQMSNQQQQEQHQENWRGGGDTEKKVVVDRGRLRHLLTKTVDKTNGYTVERLERLHTVYSHLIYRHRRNHDKLTLTQELESALDKFIRK